MTLPLYTVDVELSLMAQWHGMDARENADSAVFGNTRQGEFGIGYQMKRLNEHRLKGVFFVEALHCEILGTEQLQRIVAAILDAGHEVQLHAHVEWFWWADGDKKQPRSVRGMANLAKTQQRDWLCRGADLIENCGAPRPIAFRAGGFEANDDTLGAVAEAGMKFDSSYNAAQSRRFCRISPRYFPNASFQAEGITEIPLTGFADRPGHLRPLQLCAASAEELEIVISTMRARGESVVNILSHSFELLSRRRTRPNKMLLARLDRYLDILQSAGPTVGFADLDETALIEAPCHQPPKSGRMSTLRRMAAQAIGQLMYDRTPYTAPTQPTR